MIFNNVLCSQCGQSFGPGNHGFSHCEDHLEISMRARAAWRKDKHTPGPWNVSVSRDGDNVYLLWGSDDNYPLPDNVSTRFSNARLMSAAPEMLEALRKIHANPDGARIIAAEAIAKATGEGE